MKLELEVKELDVSRIVLQGLQEAKEDFNDIYNVPKVSYDKKEEKKYIKKMNKAFDMLIDYYGG